MGAKVHINKLPLFLLVSDKEREMKEHLKGLLFFSGRGNGFSSLLYKSLFLSSSVYTYAINNMRNRTQQPFKGQ